MGKKQDRKRRAIQKAKREEAKKTKSTSISRPNFGQAFLKWRKDRPKKLIQDLKELGYLKKPKPEE